MLSSIAKRFFLGNLMAAMLFLSANASVAPVRYNYEISKSNRASLTFKGTDSNDYLTFNVVYSNPAATPFKLTITDNLGELIYTDTYQDVQFNKTFKLLKDDISKLNFTIRDAKTGDTEKFNVYINTGVTENVVVSRKK